MWNVGVERSPPSEGAANVPTGAPPAPMLAQFGNPAAAPFETKPAYPLIEVVVYVGRALFTTIGLSSVAIETDSSWSLGRSGTSASCSSDRDCSTPS